MSRSCGQKGCTTLGQATTNTMECRLRLLSCRGVEADTL